MEDINIPTGNNYSNGGPPPERHVAVFAFPFSSHPPLLLTLIRRLSSASPAVVFTFFNTAKSNRSLFSDFTTHNNIRPFDISDGIPEGYVFQGKPQEDINLFLAVAEKELRKGVKAAEAEIGMKVSCLVVDAFFWFSGDMAEEMNIPWVAFWTAGACSLTTHFYTDLIRSKSSQLLKGSSASLNENEKVDFIPGLSAIQLSDLQGGIISGNLESPFSTMLHKMGKAISRATAVPINSFQKLDPDLTKTLSSELNNFLNIGPFNLINPPSKTDKFCCISWLKNQKPRSVAYISFGTVCRPQPHELAAMAEALEETKTPFLWSINDDSKKYFPEGFLERTIANGSGKVVPWAPQVQILEDIAIGVFITHGGWNSVLESIGAGVPMICRPFFGDQQINSWRIEEVWGIGVRIEGGSFTKSGTRYALEKVLSRDGSSKRMNERIEGLKEVAHMAVKEPNGSSIKDFETLVDVVTRAG